MCSGLEIKKLKCTVNCDFNKLCLYFSIYTAGILCICHMSSHGLRLDIYLGLPTIYSSRKAELLISYFINKTNE